MSNIKVNAVWHRIEDGRFRPDEGSRTELDARVTQRSLMVQFPSGKVFRIPRFNPRIHENVLRSFRVWHRGGRTTESFYVVLTWDEIPATHKKRASA